jgi:hypothetical protein
MADRVRSDAMRSSLAALLVLCGVARAELPSPIAVKSAVTTSRDADSWKVVATGSGMWCQARLSPSETYTITLVAPTAISSVVLTAETSVASAEITADGKPFKAQLVADKLGTGHGTITVKLGGGAVSTLVIALGGAGRGCVSRIELGAPVVYGADASTLWADVRALKAALAKCAPQSLAATFAFPFEIGWYTEDNDGMKAKSAKFTTANKLATGCKQNKYLRGASAALELTAPTVESTSSTALDISEDGAVWHFELVDGHWRARSVHEG